MWTRKQRDRLAKIARKIKRYPSDLMDEEWGRIAPLMPKIEFCEGINAIRYLVRSGRGWRLLPVHFGQLRTVYGWFRERARRFLFQTIHDFELMLDRERSRSKAVGCGDRQRVGQSAAWRDPRL